MCLFHDGCDIPSFSNVDFIVKDDVMKKAKELAELLAQSEEVQHYRRAEAQIQGHVRVQQLIETMKKRQKELVAFQNTFKNEEMVAKIEQELVQLQDELDAIPIIGEFQQSQADINYLLQTVVNIVRDTVSDKLQLEQAEKA